MKLIVEPSVTIITPTIGSSKLTDAIQSVINQDYTNIRHVVVKDGPVSLDDQVIDQKLLHGPNNPYISIVSLPENTGALGYYGHRIYAAFSYLTNSDFVVFLDEDNWFQPNHISSLVDIFTQKQSLNFAYSLRQIYSPDKQFICNDDCESLGKWPIWLTYKKDPMYLIDTSSFMFRNYFLRRKAHHWYYGWGGDRHFLEEAVLSDNTVKYETTGKYTLCYRLDGNPSSVSEKFFLEGNEFYHKIYGDNLPWRK